MSYQKSEQTAKTEVTKKICSVCKKKRDLRFFSSKRALICNDCKRKAWIEKLKESPGRVNKVNGAEWTKNVKERAGYRCEYCGSTERLNSHHVFSRSNRAVRWDIDNGCCLCCLHHTFSTQFSAHKTPMVFAEWIKSKRGDSWYESLKNKAIKT